MPRSWPITYPRLRHISAHIHSPPSVEGRHRYCCFACIACIACIARTRRASSPVRATGLSRWRATPAAIHRAAAVAAVRADIPLQLQQMVAAWARATQLGAARWADLEVTLDTVVAGRTGLALGHLRQQ